MKSLFITIIITSVALLINSLGDMNQSTEINELQGQVKDMESKVEKAKPQTESAQTLTDDAREQLMVTLTNRYRATQGLNYLTINDQLMTSAQLKADDLCTAGNWSHTDSKGRDFWGHVQDAGYPYQRVGENLARRFATEQEALDGLIASPGHHENLVGQYTEIGVGFNECGGENYTAVHYGEAQ